MKRLVSLLLVLALLFPLFAGGAQEEASDSGAYKIALIVENTIDDKGWCQAMYDGIVEAQKQLPGKIELSYSEKMAPVNAGSVARQYCAQGYKLIIMHGAQYKNLALEMADEYPDISFAFGTTAEVGPDNVFTYLPESEETGYLSGMVAGMTTKNNIVGCVGPVDGGDAARYDRGFVLGAEAVNPNCKVMVTHTGSFSDFVKAGDYARAFIKDGADVLTGSTQQAIGALRAVAEFRNEDIWWVGQDTAQLKIEEGYKCIAASSYNYAAVVIGIVECLDQGIKGGRNVRLNFNNGGFIWKWNEDLKTPELEKAVNAQIEKFKAEAGTLPQWSDVTF